MDHTRTHHPLRAAAVVIGLAVTLGATAAPALAAAPAGVLAGTVTDAAGRPLAGVTVTVFDADGFGGGAPDATTNSRGGYTVRGLAAGAPGYRVQFGAAAATGGTSPTGYPDVCLGGGPDCRIDSASTPRPTVVTVTRGAVTRADIALPRAATLSGRLTDTLGRGIGGVAVAVGRGEQDAVGGRIDLATTVSETDGTWQVRRVLPAATAVCFGRADGGRTGTALPARDGYLGACWSDADLLAGPQAATTVVAAPGRVRTGIDQVLTGLGAVSGRVVDEQGRPVQGATVQVGEDREGDLVLRATTAVTDADGRYRVAQVVPGSQGICVVAAGFGGSCPLPPAATVTVTSFRTVAAPPIVLTRS